VRDPAPNQIVVPARGSAGDPTAGGARLAVYNAAGSGELAEVALPASGWQALGTGSPPKGYRFRDLSGALGVQSITLKPNKLTLKGGGAGLAYTLDEPSQGRMALRLRFGDATPWCADLPPKPGADEPDGFQALPKAPAPAVCPPLPH